MKVELKLILDIIEKKTSWGKEQLKQDILLAIAELNEEKQND